MSLRLNLSLIQNPKYLSSLLPLLKLQTDGSDGKKSSPPVSCHERCERGSESVDKICLSLSLRLTHSPI